MIMDKAVYGNIFSFCGKSIWISACFVCVCLSFFFFFSLKVKFSILFPLPLFFFPFSLFFLFSGSILCQQPSIRKSCTIFKGQERTRHVLTVKHPIPNGQVSRMVFSFVWIVLVCTVHLVFTLGKLYPSYTLCV